MTIRNLSQGTATLASQVPFYDTDNGVDRRCSLTELQALILGDESADLEGWMTQYAAPSASGFSVTITPTQAGQSVWLLLLPVAAYAAGTIVLPALATLLDRQMVEVVSTQAVTALTVSGNGAAVTGGPTALVANVPVKLRFDAATATWYRAA